MGITAITRDYGDNVSIVRITTTDTLATASAANYITDQADNIALANNGAFTWLVSDMTLVYASDGWMFAGILDDFTSLVPMVFNTTLVNGPAVVGNFASFASTGGNIEDLGYLPSDASKTSVVMAGSSVTIGRLAKFVDTAGTIDDTAGAAVNLGNITAGASGTAGYLASFPATGSKGSLRLTAVANTGDTVTTISNVAMGQASVISIPDPGAATSDFVLSQSTAPTNNVTFTKVITATAAALASAGTVTVQSAPSVTSQFAVLDVKVLKSTGLSGGGGDRLLSLTDGTIVFNNAGITAALLGTPILTVWGGSGNPLAVGASEITTAGDDLVLTYSGGAADYTTGSVQLAVTLVQVTA